MCSDGLYGGSTDAQIAHMLASCNEVSLDTCCAELIEAAKRDGSRDNVTAVLIQSRW